jgi:hypothetical protein
VTVISVGDRWLKLLHATGREPFRRVDLLLAHPIAGTDPDEILNRLKEVWGLKGLKPGAVLIANPSHLTTVRLFTLPSVDPKEIQEIVALQAERHTPYAKEEILTDHLVIESDRSGYSRVLVIISHQDVVHRGLRLVSGMGWPFEKVGFEWEGLAHWFRGINYWRRCSICIDTPLPRFYGVISASSEGNKSCSEGPPRRCRRYLTWWLSFRRRPGSPR